MVRKLAEATGSISISMRGEKGETGNNGVGVKGFNTYYGLSSSKSSPPTTYNYDTLSETIISQNSEKYVWSADKVLYTDGTGDDFINAYCIGKCSDLTSVKEQYGTSTSAGTKPSSWGYSYPSNPANGTYVWSRDEIVWAGNNSTTHSDAQLIGYIAVNGANGNGIKSTEVTYQIGSSGTTPPKGTWSTSVPNITDANPYLWTRTIFKYTNGSSSDPSYSVATRGTKGALMREHDGFESGKYKYLSGSGAEKYVDVVYIKDSDKWWQCIVTYDDDEVSDSPSLDDGHWEVMNSYKSIATHLLLAENATINMLGTNQINMYTPSSGAMYGSLRVVNNDNDWSLWLGGKDGDSASFAVTRGGAIRATAGQIGSFSIESFTDATGFTFYGLKAKHAAYGIIPWVVTEMDYRGIHVESGSNNDDVTNDHITTDIMCSSGGAISISGNTLAVADNVTAIYTSLVPKTGYRSYALRAPVGDVLLDAGAFIGALRPNTTTDRYSRTLSESECYIICKNTSAITLTLPTNPREGQLYLVYQAGARVNFSTSSSHPIIAKGYGSAEQTTWYSDTQNQLSFITYGNDGRWYIAYTNG